MMKFVSNLSWTQLIWKIEAWISSYRYSLEWSRKQLDPLPLEDVAAISKYEFETHIAE